MSARAAEAAGDAAPDARAPGWIVGPTFDLVWIVGPAVLALAIVAGFPQVRAAGAETPLWAWVACILAVDVAHVWSTIFRTYLDRVELARRPALYTAVPAVCLGVGILLHSLSPTLFWRVLAYVAVLHFVRQQYGLVALYGMRGGWPERLDARLDKLAIYAATLYPIVVWHTRLPRPFVWFTPGDFAALPSWIEPPARLVWIVALASFALRQLQLIARGTPVSAGRVLIVLTTAVTWYTGIVACEADWAFTVLNVLAHGIPYMALVWVYTSSKHAAGEGWLARVSRPGWLPIFLGVLVLLAWCEESLWDNIVWQERAAVFGDVRDWFEWARSKPVLSLVVPLLSLPQATHYVLDAYLWKFDGSNPDLAEHLFGK